MRRHLTKPTSNFEVRTLVVLVFVLCTAVAAFAQSPSRSELPTNALNPDQLMVAVEALVVEVDEERTRDLGLEYGFNPRHVLDDGSVVLEDSSIVAGGNIRLERPLEPVRIPLLIPALEGDNSVDFSERLPGLGVNLAGMNLSSQVVSARLRALLDQGEAVIRTRPIAVALNGTDVLIETVNNIPYLDRKDNGKLEIAEKKVGIEMRVTPSIRDLATRLIDLRISSLKVSSVSSYITTQNIDRPVVNRSETQSRVTLREGETFVFGGLKMRRYVRYEDRVPLLGRIPLVGLLFRSQEDLERNLDVLFFITPYVLRPGENFLLPFDFRNSRELGVDVTAERSER